MLKLKPDPTFHADVRLTVPGAEEPAVVRFEFRHMTVDGVQQWLRDNEAKPLSDALAGIVAGWHSGIDAPYSDAALAELVRNYPAAAFEIVRGYQIALTESRVKN